MSDMPNIGDPAPDFSLPDGDGNQVNRKDLEGTTTILYFYPKDDTPGCTKEACSFRDVQAEIQKAGAQVYGVSADGVESHRVFIDKYGLNFPLLADEDTAVSQAYGVWRERTVRGRTFMGIARTTFAIDESGKIARVWTDIDAEEHGNEVLAWLQTRRQ